MFRNLSMASAHLFASHAFPLCHTPTPPKTHTRTPISHTHTHMYLPAAFISYLCGWLWFFMPPLASTLWPHLLSPDIKLMRLPPFWALSHTLPHAHRHQFYGLIHVRPGIGCPGREAFNAIATKCISRSPIKRRSLRAPNQNRSRSRRSSTAR